MTLTQAIRTAYFTALNGNISAAVMDSFAPDEMEPPYVVLSTQTATEDSSKDCRGYNTTILIDIVTKFPEPAGRGLTETIAEEIENIISPSRGFDIPLPDDYHIYETQKEMDTDMTDKSGSQYIYRKLLTYRHLI